VGEVSVDVRHCLMALPGVAKHELRRVQSHPQAWAQLVLYTLAAYRLSEVSCRWCLQGQGCQLLACHVLKGTILSMAFG
jgi:hypothetical protein